LPDLPAVTIMHPLENQQKPAPSYQTLLFICCAVCFGCYSAAYMRIPVLPLFARSLGADTFQIGVITSSFMLTAGIFCLPLGIMSDRLGRKRLILIGLLISALSSFVIGFCKNPWQMMAVYLFSGAGLAAFAPTMMSFVTDISPRTHLGRSYGWYTMAMYGGMSLGPAMGGFAGQFLNFQWVFIISGILVIPMFWVIVCFLPRRRALHLSPPVERRSGLIIRELLHNRSLLACWLVTLGSCFALGVFVTFAPLHASDQGIGIGEIGIIFGTQALVNALCRIPFGYLSDKVSDRSTLVFTGLLGYSASIAGIGLATSLSFFLISAFAMGISQGIAFTAVGALISEVVPPDSRGLAMGGYNTCIYAGMMVSALVMGMVTRELGFRTGFLITALVNVASAFAFSIMFRTVPLREDPLPDN
jgi:MFS transporter, DHA1 family, multidrug resistance protein